VKTFIVLFRAINVGGNNIVPMKQLTTLLTNDHYQNVKTYIQSGNVVLSSTKRPDNHISKLVQDEFGFKPQIIVLDQSEFMAAVKNNPFSASEGKSIHFYFCHSKPKLNREIIDSLKAASEQYTLKNKIFYLYAPDGIGKSKLVAKIESCLGVPATGRNLNTINKIQSMLANSG